MITTSVGPLGVGRLSMPATLLRTVNLSPATIGRAYSKLCSACSKCLPCESIRPSRRSVAALSVVGKVGGATTLRYPAARAAASSK